MCVQEKAYVEFMLVDLASLHSVKEMADQFVKRGLPLHVLVCNAGVFGGSLRLVSLIWWCFKHGEFSFTAGH